MINQRKRHRGVATPAVLGNVHKAETEWKFNDPGSPPSQWQLNLETLKPIKICSSVHFVRPMSNLVGPVKMLEQHWPASGRRSPPIRRLGPPSSPPGWSVWRLRPSVKKLSVPNCFIVGLTGAEALLSAVKILEDARVSSILDGYLKPPKCYHINRL